VDVFDTSVLDPALDAISLGVAVILIVLYILSLIFTFQSPGREEHTGVDDHSGEEEQHKANWSVPFSIGILAASTIAIVFLSELLVGAVEPVVESLGVSELFLGVIIIPIVGNVAEHIVGVQVAIKNKMDLSLTISLGSSMQVALFVAPWLAIVAVATGGFLYLRTGGTNTAPAVTGGAPADDAGGVARALAAQGITGVAASTDAASVPGALTQGFSGDGSHVHDKGKQPTFTQLETMSVDALLTLFPADTVSAADVPQLKQQVEPYGQQGPEHRHQPDKCVSNGR
jgi:hypothetical protein